MFFILKMIKFLNSDAHPAQIAGGALIGCMLGFTPMVGPHTALLLTFLLIFRVNVGTALFFWGITKPLAFALLPDLGISIGQAMLADGSNTRAWLVKASLTPVIGLVEWKKHAVVGGMVTGAGLGLLLFFPIIAVISGYRAAVKEKIRNSKGMKAASNSLLGKLVKGILEGTPE